MAIRILTDSTSDLSPQEAEEKGVWLMPMQVLFGDTPYLDSIDIDHPTFYQMLTQSEDFPTTTQLTPNEFLTWFERAREAGDEVVCIPLAATLSGTFQNALIAKDMCDYDGIHVVDARMATVPLRMVVDYACALRDKGLPAADIAAQTLAAARRVRVYGMVDTLEYLHKGGRISGAVKVVGSMLRVKPLITIDQHALSVTGKAMGIKKGFAALIESLGPAMDIDPQLPCLYYGYCGSDENCRQLMELAEEAYHPAAAQIHSVGAIIGAHLGPGATIVGYIEAPK